MLNLAKSVQMNKQIAQIARFHLLHTYGNTCDTRNVLGLQLTIILIID